MDAGKRLLRRHPGPIGDLVWVEFEPAADRASMKYHANIAYEVAVGVSRVQLRRGMHANESIQLDAQRQLFPDFAYGRLRGIFAQFTEP